MSQDFSISSLIPDPDFEFLSVLGSGSFGFVFEVKDRKTNTIVAIKRSLKITNIVSREYEVLEMLKGSEHWVQLLDIFYTLDFHTKVIQNLVLEYMPWNLQQFITKKDTNIENRKEIMRQLWQGLVTLKSKNLMHRDLKPENVLIDNSYNKNLTIKLWDFGSAKEAGSKSTPYIVSRYYRAPELILCNIDYDQAIDIWSLGCIFAEMYNGRVLFPGKTDGDQLLAIARVIGPPQYEDLEALVINTPLDPSRVYRIYNKVNAGGSGLRRIFGNDELAMNLVQSMVEWNPANRLTAEQCLAHPYFSS